MKYRILFILLYSLSSISHAESLSRPVIEKNVTVNQRKLLITIEVNPSPRNPKFSSYCQPGEEVTLKVFSAGKLSFSKLIESCVESIELENGELGNETARSLSAANNFDKKPIELSWLTMKDKTNVVGILDLSSKKPVYSETQK